MFRVSTGMLAFVILTSGCTTTASDPTQAASEAPTAVFIFGHEALQDHLNARRIELARLRAKITQHDEMLLLRIGEVRAMRRALENARTSTVLTDAERAAAQRELAEVQEQANAVYQQVLTAEREEIRLKEAIVKTDTEVRKDREAVNQFKTKIEEQEKQVRTVERAMERTRNLRAMQVLRADGGLD